MGRWTLLVAVLALSAACSTPADRTGREDGRRTSSSSSTSASTVITTTAPASPAVVLAVGDIASCDVSDDESVADLVATLPGEILLLGDIAYPNGTPEQFRRCFEPAWGRFRSRLRPAPGNHDFRTARGAGYFGWFVDAAGEPGKGWYSFDVGSWHVVALNSNCAAVGGCGADSDQERWLRADLANSRARCTLGFWHHPRFSSGALHGSNPIVDGLWRALVDAGADVVLSGHEHSYERLAPLDAGGRLDARRGIRSFVVGTGGRSHYRFGKPIKGSEARDGSTFGVLALTLSPDSFRWRFVPVEGGTFADQGEGGCH